MNNPDERFLPLKDAMSCLNQKVNLLGSVVEFGLPRKSKGTDYVCTLKIVDESHQTPAVSVNIFVQKTEELPRVKSAGDLIQLSHVEMKSYDMEVYALFKKKFSSFALFEGKSSKDFNPYQVSSKFCARDGDKQFITHLRTWLLNFQLDAGTSEYLLLLKEIKDGQHFDLICKILLVCEVSKDKWMLFVWDGTDTPPSGLRTKLGDEAENPLPLQLEPSMLSRDILRKFPCVGSILRVVVDQAYENFDVPLLGSDQWVRLRNITCKVHSGLWRGVLMHSSKLRFLSDEDNIVLQRLRNYNERISSKWGRLPLSSSPCPSQITETDNEHVPCVTLMDLLTYSEVTAKFKCVVRAVALYPWRAEDFRSPIGMREYRMRLTLEDPTARIHAFLYAEDGVKFFEGYPPVDILTRKRNKLLGVTAKDNGEEDENVPRNPPWVQCCIKSYYLDKTDGWGSRHYRIFGTRLVA